jgi:hypothetical protein
VADRKGQHLSDAVDAAQKQPADLADHAGQDECEGPTTRLGEKAGASASGQSLANTASAATTPGTARVRAAA